MKKSLIVFLAILIMAAFSSCELKETPTTDTQGERTNFINANTDFSCFLLKNSAALNTQEDFDKQLFETYKKYNLPVENHLLMISILDKYENDQEVNEIVKTNSAPCKDGGSPVFY